MARTACDSFLYCLTTLGKVVFALLINNCYVFVPLNQYKIYRFPLRIKGPKSENYGYEKAVVRPLKF
jgi:hypothetical protein